MPAAAMFVSRVVPASCHAHRACCTPGHLRFYTDLNHMRISLVLATAAIFATSLSSQSVGRSYNKYFGSSNAGASIHVYSGASKTYSGGTHTGKASISGSARVRFLGQSLEAAKAYAGITGRKTSTRVSGSASAYLRIAGRTVYSRSYSRSYPTAWTFWSRPTKSKIFARDPRATFTVGPVPITVSGNVGAGTKISIKGSIANSWTKFASLSGVGEAWGHGNASVSAGVPGARIGVEANLKFAHHTLTISGWIGRYGPGGSCIYRLNPISLKIALFVQVLWKKYSKTVASYNYRSIYYTLWRR